MRSLRFLAIRMKVSSDVFLKEHLPSVTLKETPGSIRHRTSGSRTLNQPFGVSERSSLEITADSLPKNMHENHRKLCRLGMCRHLNNVALKLLNESNTLGEEGKDKK